MNNTLAFLQTQIGKNCELSVSPLMRWMSPVLLSAEEGKLTFNYTIRPEMTNPLGNLHGGMSAAIIDDAIGAAVYSYGESFYYMTINNVIDYFGPARLGERLYVESSILKKGKQLVHAQCEIWNEDQNKMIARGYSNLIKTAIEK